MVNRFSQTDFAARLQNVVSERRREAGLYREITEKLPLPDQGRLLDIGTGSGLQLEAIRRARPNMELYGLDLSRWAIRIAKANLVGLNIRLRQGTIEQAPYRDGFFDVVTCHSSMSYWKPLAPCLNEVFRILKPGGTAVFFEPHKEVDVDRALEAIREGLADEGPLRRYLAVSMNKLALRRGQRVGLRLYGMDELGTIIAATHFGNSYSIEETELLKVPIHMQITMIKAG
ncbi:MAG: class I SAM-dependent methyltransferase [Anaerolineales bacterium]|nr:class I SAM-dependent methyltransferase [Anaerolineales bacterium]